MAPPYPQDPGLHRGRRTVTVGVLVAALAGLAAPAQADARSQPQPQSRPSIQSIEDGDWLADGYRRIVTVHDGRLRTFDLSAAACLPGLLTADQAGPPDATGAVRFLVDGQPELTIRPAGPPAAGMVFKLADDVTEIRLRRLPALPSACERPPATDPRAVFDFFWSTFAENYPFFAAKGVDWQAVRARYGPRVTDRTSDAELFAILSAMVRPLNDAHVGIVASDGRRFWQPRPDTLPILQDGFTDRAWQTTDARLGRTPADFATFAQGRLAFTELSHGVGYLRVTSFRGYAASDSYQDNEAELDRALDAILTPARTAGPDALRGLVLDLRINGGGSDELALRLASRLTASPYLAYRKQARDDPADPTRFTRPQPVQVPGSPGTTYTGPVTLLTSSASMSAAETFAQALLGRQPQPVRIGAATQGIFSDILERALPNGWTFGLPNERYLTADHRTFDGTGIPPNIPAPVFTEDELTHHRDSALDIALPLLGG